MMARHQRQALYWFETLTGMDANDKVVVHECPLALLAVVVVVPAEGLAQHILKPMFSIHNHYSVVILFMDLPYQAV